MQSWKLTVNEIFYSLQGEGARAGTPNVFIRLSKCNLACSFCDTNFEAGTEMSLEEIEERIRNFPAKNIIWTGGEPALQLNQEVVDYFSERGYFQAVETNGTKPLPKGLYIVCSPKIRNRKLIENFPDGVDEVKVVLKKGWRPPPFDILPKAKHYFLSPIFDGAKLNYENLYWCIGIILEDPRWKLTIQNHKIWRMR